jgi:hypothetical protein
MNSGGGPWKGDEVTDKSDGQAEAVAERAADRGPVPVAAAVNRERSEERVRSDQAASDKQTGKKANAAEAAEGQEEKRQAAVEQHKEDRAAGTGTAPKNI